MNYFVFLSLSLTICHFPSLSSFHYHKGANLLKTCYMKFIKIKVKVSK